MYRDRCLWVCMIFFPPQELRVGTHKHMPRKPWIPKVHIQFKLVDHPYILFISIASCVWMHTSFSRHLLSLKVQKRQLSLGLEMFFDVCHPSCRSARQCSAFTGINWSSHAEPFSFIIWKALVHGTFWNMPNTLIAIIYHSWSDVVRLPRGVLLVHLFWDRERGCVAIQRLRKNKTTCRSFIRIFSLTASSFVDARTQCACSRTCLVW